MTLPYDRSSIARGAPILAGEGALLDAHLDPVGKPTILDDIESLLKVDSGSPAAVREALAESRMRAEGIAAAISEPLEAERVAALTFAAAALAVVWLDARPGERELEQLLTRVSHHLELHASTVRIAIFLHAVRDRHVLDLPPQLGAETVLQMFCAFTPATHASLWASTPEGRLSELVRTGEGESTRRARA